MTTDVRDHRLAFSLSERGLTFLRSVIATPTVADRAIFSAFAYVNAGRLADVWASALRGRSGTCERKVREWRKAVGVLVLPSEASLHPVRNRMVLWAFVPHAKPLGAVDRIVLAYIITHGSAEWGCYVGKETIADELALSETAVKESLRRLHKRGFVRVRRIPGGKLWDGQVVRSREISPRWDRMDKIIASATAATEAIQETTGAECTPADGAPSRQNTPLVGADGAPSGVHFAPLPPADGAPDLSLKITQITLTTPRADAPASAEEGEGDFDSFAEGDESERLSGEDETAEESETRPQTKREAVDAVLDYLEAGDFPELHFDDVTRNTVASRLALVGWDVDVILDALDEQKREGMHEWAHNVGALLPADDDEIRGLADAERERQAERRGRAERIATMVADQKRADEERERRLWREKQTANLVKVWPGVGFDAMGDAERDRYAAACSLALHASSAFAGLSHYTRTRTGLPDVDLLADALEADTRVVTAFGALADRIEICRRWATELHALPALTDDAGKALRRVALGELHALRPASALSPLARCGT